MSITFRHYNNSEDYNRVDAFLIQHYQPGNADGNWIAPAWEYMHGHPMLDKSSLGKIGIWEEDGKIVAVAHYESSLGEAFFQFDSHHGHLKAVMLDYAEQNLYGNSMKDGRTYIKIYVNDWDAEFISLAEARGYEKDSERTRPMYSFEIPNAFLEIKLPDGYRLKSLADECNWAKVHRVLWRGFNHEGEPPAGEEELESRRKMFDTPNARRDLKIVVVDPEGNFVSFCGMFHESTHHFAYVEPVATDPDHRRMGLGKAAVMEGIRRCGMLGSTVAYVGSDQEFYKAIGFKKVYNTECWVKHFDNAV